jgi:hypothetical protein
MPLGVDAKVNLTELLQAIVISPVAPSFVAELVLMTTKRSGLDQLVRKSSLCGTPAY